MSGYAYAYALVETSLILELTSSIGFQTKKSSKRISADRALGKNGVDQNNWTSGKHLKTPFSFCKR